MGNKRILLQGNEAVVEGAIAGGCRFFGGYPITPASEILEVFSERMPQAGGAFIQMEDELAAISSVLGASIGGARALTATSGPGMSLMSEILGLAIIEEIPCVVVDVQRVGPGAGMIFTSQGDVMYAKWGTPGGNEIIAISPASVKECFDLTIKCINLAERFRVPVFLLSDAQLGHLREVIDIPEESEIEKVDRVKPDYAPEKFASFEAPMGGVPHMADLGTAYRSRYTHYLHDNRGVYGPSIEQRQFILDRLRRKITDHMDEITMIEQSNMDDAEIAVFAYGIVSRPAKAAIRAAREKGIKAGLFRPITLWPFPEKEVAELAKKVKKIVVVELNYGQLLLEVERASKGQAEITFYGKDVGVLITPDEILAAITEGING